MKYKVFAVMSIVVLLGSMLVAVASADTPTDTSELRDAVTKDGVATHMAALEALGPRPADSGAYLEASEYVHDQLDAAGYNVWYQDFTYDLWEELSLPTLKRVSPDPVTEYPAYPPLPSDWGFATMEYSGAGNVTAPVVHAANFGCEPTDFDAADFTDNIALILRGVCTFATKAVNAKNAGAAGAIVYNDEARHEVFYGTLGSDVVVIPVVGTSWAVGLDLSGENVVAQLTVDAVMHENVPTRNVIAETLGGRDDRVVVVGAHLDSVAEGPGTNDNGSGVAAILEVALKMADLGIEPRNKVRFAFWSAEESGLIGSEYYVSQLDKRGIKNIALNLNFDMLASENYAPFVYDGDGSDTTDGAGPNGSANVEDIFVDYFDTQGWSTYPTALDGRSDYDSFAAVGIPVGGLFTGADGIKTEEQAAIYGGTAGAQYDRNYHTPDDTLANADLDALDLMSDGVAHAVLTFAMTTSAVPGTSKGATQATKTPEFKGPKAQK